MKPSSFSVIGGFFLRAMLWLAPLLALWFWARNWVIQPPAWLAEQSMLWLFPGWVLDAEFETAGELSLLTTLRIESGGGVGELTVDSRVLKYAHGMPLLLALLFASRANGLWWKVPAGLLLLVPFQAWGVCFEWLVDIAIHLGSHTQAQTGFDALHANLFGLGMQMGYLIFPTLIPLVFWMATEQRFLRTVIMDGALKQLTSQQRNS